VQCKSARAPFVTVDYLNPYVELEGLTAGTYQVELMMNPPAKVLWDEKVLLEIVIQEEAQIPVPLPLVAEEN